MIAKEKFAPTKYLLDRGAIVTATITSWTLSEITVISRRTWNSICNNRYYDSNSSWTLTASKIWAVCQKSLCWAERWSYCWLLSYKNKSFHRPNDGVCAKRKRKNTKDEEKSKDIRDMLKKLCMCIMKPYNTTYPFLKTSYI